MQQTAQDQHCGIQSKSRQIANRYLDEFQTVLAIKCEQVIKHLKKIWSSAKVTVYDDVFTTEKELPQGGGTLKL